MTAARRRLGQGLRALMAFATSPDLNLARRYLTERELAEFVQLSRADQLHCLNVLRAVLRANPEAPPALTAAALLHDVGKSRYHLRVWQKTLAVLVLGLAPAHGRNLTLVEPPNSWRAPFIVHELHPKWSGELLRECGSEAAVIWLAENHHNDAEQYRGRKHYSLLKALQAADGIY